MAARSSWNCLTSNSRLGEPPRLIYGWARKD
jgi:hypothetical protein